MMGEALDRLTQEVLDQRWYSYVRVGHDDRPMEFLPDSRIGVGGAMCERTWLLERVGQTIHLVIRGYTFTTCNLIRTTGGEWHGRWLEHERMPVRLEPISRRDSVPENRPEQDSEYGFFVKIYGSQRSGTNYLEWLVKHNFLGINLLVDETGWKHGRIPETVDWSGANWAAPHIDPELRRRRITDRVMSIAPVRDHLKRAIRLRRFYHLIICKNPYSWYASFSRIKGEPCSPVRGDRIRHWGEMNAHWHDFFRKHPAQCMFLRYEDLLRQPEALLTDALRERGMKRAESTWQAPPGQMTAFGRPSVKPFDLSYYLDERYLDRFEAQDLHVFRDNLPLRLMERLRYPVIDPNSRPSHAETS